MFYGYTLDWKNIRAVLHLVDSHQPVQVPQCVHRLIEPHQTKGIFRIEVVDGCGWYKQTGEFHRVLCVFL